VVAGDPPAERDTLSLIQVLEAAVRVLRGMGEEQRAASVGRVVTRLELEAAEPAERTRRRRG
jgi:hypothetical protein